MPRSAVRASRTGRDGLRVENTCFRTSGNGRFADAVDEFTSRVLQKHEGEKARYIAVYNCFAQLVAEKGEAEKPAEPTAELMVYQPSCEQSAKLEPAMKILVGNVLERMEQSSSK
ncbi:hypothetical protein CISG_06231 [Coccidioides immitis RMSCC 3703]|uniref:Uncharacterized protein n=2 Tax=Coccidioides immitis TaxID=5501 RepID=A0A0J8QX28_COCIT|nr:hypothetical protein CIRG_06453 [Coccidioides immitis RMSCC 2394]KMU76996.1 hypothetical protein CISG_06231 [Coccidioides immitis RMSCC 3703]